MGCNENSRVRVLTSFGGLSAKSFTDSILSLKVINLLKADSSFLGLDTFPFPLLIFWALGWFQFVSACNKLPENSVT